ncbi:unnamed protein product, partial [Brassica oleracea]
IGLSHSRYVTDFPCWMRREQMFFGFVNHGPLAYVAVQLTEAFLAEAKLQKIGLERSHFYQFQHFSRQPETMCFLLFQH